MACAITIPRTGLREMGNKPTMEPKINCTQDNQDDAGQTTIDQFKTTVGAAAAISAWPCPVYVPLDSPLKILAH